MLPLLAAHHPEHIQLPLQRHHLRHGAHAALLHHQRHLLPEGAAIAPGEPVAGALQRAQRPPEGPAVNAVQLTSEAKEQT